MIEKIGMKNGKKKINLVQVIEEPVNREVLLTLLNAELFDDVLTQKKIEKITGIKDAGYILKNLASEEYKLILQKNNGITNEDYYILDNKKFYENAYLSDSYFKYLMWYKIPKEIQLTGGSIKTSDIMKSFDKKKPIGLIENVFEKLKCRYLQFEMHEDETSHFLVRSGSRYLLHISTLYGQKLKDNIPKITNMHAYYNRNWKKREIFSINIVPNVKQDDLLNEVRRQDIQILVMDIYNFLYWLNFFNKNAIIDKILLDKNYENEIKFSEEQKQKIFQYLPIWFEDSKDNVLKFNEFVDFIISNKYINPKGEV